METIRYHILKVYQISIHIDNKTKKEKIVTRTRKGKNRN